MGAQDVKQIEAEDLQQNGVDSSSGGQPEKKGFVKLIRNGLSKKGQIVRWAKKGGLAALDQGLFSGANFLVNILLARWLAPKEYGAFAVALSVFYLLAGFHTAVLTEPMMVFGAGKYREQFRKYLGMLFYGHWGLSALIALLLAGAAFVMRNLGSEAMAQALAGLAIASPFLLLLWLTRRGCYAEMRPQWAVLGSSINLAVVLAGLFLLWRAGLLSSLSGLVLLGAAAGIASLALTALHLRPRLLGFTGNLTKSMLIKDHWRYGKWSTATVLLMWVPGNIYYSLFPITDGLATSGALRALHNLVLPLLQAMSALGLLVLPSLSATVYSESQTLFQRKVWRLLFFFVGGAAVYWAILAMLHHPLVEWLYGEKYAREAYLLVILGFLPVSAGAVSVLGAALRSLERPDYVFRAYLLTFASGLVVGVPMTISFGLPGAILGQIISSLTTASAMGWGFLKLCKGEQGN